MRRRDVLVGMGVLASGGGDVAKRSADSAGSPTVETAGFHMPERGGVVSLTVGDGERDVRVMLDRVRAERLSNELNEALYEAAVDDPSSDSGRN